MRKFLLLIALLPLSACLSTAIGVTGAVVGTAVKTTGAVAGAAIGAVTPHHQRDRDKDRGASQPQS